MHDVCSFHDENKRDENVSLILVIDRTYKEEAVMCVKGGGGDISAFSLDANSYASTNQATVFSMYQTIGKCFSRALIGE